MAVAYKACTDFTPQIDCEIIHWYVDDRDAMFRRLKERYGPERAAVAERAAPLGIDQRFIEQLQISGVSYAPRKCLGCDREFFSKGPGNRFCPKCSKRSGQS